MTSSSTQTHSTNEFSSQIDEINTLHSALSEAEARSSHFSNYCTELRQENEVLCTQVTTQFNTCNRLVHPLLFKGEPLDRLKEWMECLKVCIEEKEEEERGRSRKRAERRGGGGEEGACGERVCGECAETEMEMRLPGGGKGTGLSGFLTRNHQLTQKYTKYPEGSVKRL